MHAQRIPRKKAGRVRAVALHLLMAIDSIITSFCRERVDSSVYLSAVGLLPGLLTCTTRHMPEKIVAETISTHVGLVQKSKKKFKKIPKAMVVPSMHTVN